MAVKPRRSVLEDAGRNPARINDEGKGSSLDSPAGGPKPTDAQAVSRLSARATRISSSQGAPRPTWVTAARAAAVAFARREAEGTQRGGDLGERVEVRGIDGRAVARAVGVRELEPSRRPTVDPQLPTVDRAVVGAAQSDRASVFGFWHMA